MCQQEEEERQGKLELTKELARQTYDLGIALNLRVTWEAAMALPWGLAAAGAAATRTLVDAGDVKATAHMTALMVKLGWLNLVRDIVATLSRQERADVVSKVTLNLLDQGEFAVVSKINNALISGGYTKESTAVAGVLGKQVSNKFFNSLKDAGANLLHWNRDDDKQTPGNSSGGGSELGLDSMAVDDHHSSIVDSMKAAVS